MLADEGITLDAQVFAFLGFVITCALWWTYFDDVAISRVARDEQGRRRSSAVWVYGHLPLTLALTGVGVGVRELTLVSFREPIPANHLWLVVGAVVLALLTIALLDAVTETAVYGLDDRARVTPRAVAAVFIVLVAAVGGRLPGQVTASAIAAVTVGQVAYEMWRARRADRALRVVVGQQINEGMAGTCEHLAAIGDPEPRTTGCEECLAEGETWVHLRLCASCGHVGCCDDSKLRHATRHVERSEHPVIRSLEPGEHWAWCCPYQVAADLTARGAE